jgi:hypothetical protein
VSVAKLAAQPWHHGSGIGLRRDGSIYLSHHGSMENAFDLLLYLAAGIRSKSENAQACVSILGTEILDLDIYLYRFKIVGSGYLRHYRV